MIKENERKLREKQSMRLFEELKKKYGASETDRLPRKKIFDDYNQVSSVEIGSPEQLSPLWNPERTDRPIDSFVEGFAKMLGVSEDYLLCKVDYPSETVRKQREIDALHDRWNRPINQRIADMTNFIRILDAFGFEIGYEMIDSSSNRYNVIRSHESYAIYQLPSASKKNDKQKKIVIKSEPASPIAKLSEEKFLQWMSVPSANICVSEDDHLYLTLHKIYMRDQKNPVDPDRWFSLDINDLMKMIYALNECSRKYIETFLSLKDYDYKDNFRSDILELKEGDADGSE